MCSLPGSRCHRALNWVTEGGEEPTGPSGHVLPCPHCPEAPGWSGRARTPGGPCPPGHPGRVPAAQSHSRRGGSSVQPVREQTGRRWVRLQPPRALLPCQPLSPQPGAHLLRDPSRPRAAGGPHGPAASPGHRGASHRPTGPKPGLPTPTGAEVVWRVEHNLQSEPNPIKPNPDFTPRRPGAHEGRWLPRITQQGSGRARAPRTTAHPQPRVSPPILTSWPSSFPGSPRFGP